MTRCVKRFTGLLNPLLATTSLPQADRMANASTRLILDLGTVLKCFGFLLIMKSPGSLQRVRGFLGLLPRSFSTRGNRDALNLTRCPSVANESLVDR